MTVFSRQKKFIRIQAKKLYTSYSPVYSASSFRRSCIQAMRLVSAVLGHIHLFWSCRPVHKIERFRPSVPPDEDMLFDAKPRDKRRIGTRHCTTLGVSYLGPFLFSTSSSYSLLFCLILLIFFLRSFCMYVF